MKKEGLTLEKISGNWEVTTDLINKGLDPEVDVFWYRIIPKKQFDSEKKSKIPGDAVFYVIEGDCSWEILGGVTEVRKKAFEVRGLEGSEVSVRASTTNGEVLSVKTIGGDPVASGEEFQPYKLRSIGQNAFQAANTSHPLDGRSCDFQSPDKLNPTGR